MIIFKKGDVVTCVNGHEICTVSRDIRDGDEHAAENFENWQTTPAPSAGDEIKPCPTCGGFYFLLWGDGKIGTLSTHIKGKGWTPPLPEEPIFDVADKSFIKWWTREGLRHTGTPPNAKA